MTANSDCVGLEFLRRLCCATVLNMARLARIVIPGLAHHVTQRGNRREAIFFEEGDHEIYLDLLAEQTLKAGVAVWAYCLMPNHVHLILKPTRADEPGRADGETHRRYTNFINARGRWTGHLFQSRFASVVLDDIHLIRAVGYVSLNPVRPAGLPARRLEAVQRPSPPVRGRRCAGYRAACVR